ncbi:MAG: biotin transporter BioY [Cellulosilyticaceae bacterium]
MKLTAKEMTMVGLGAALMGVFSQLSIPLPTVPLTLQVFGAILLSMVLGAKLGTLMMIVYTLIGAIGIPVFANFGRGVGVLVGPTGGYITGFIVLAFFVGMASGRNNKWILWVTTYLALILQYAIGTLQLKVVLNMSLGEAMVAGVYPFIIKDLILTGVAIIIGLEMKKRLKGVLGERIAA